MDFQRNGSKFDEALSVSAQKMTWDAVHAIAAQIRPGMTEKEAETLGMRVLREMGCRKFWHPVHIRFGVNTTKGYRDDSEPDITLQENDIFFIDIGPIFHGHEGDCGQTFTVGGDSNLRELAEKVKIIWDLIRHEWTLGSTGLELWDKSKEFAANHSLELAPLYVKGHRISDFPHEAITKQKMFEMDTTPMAKRWILEIQVVDPELQRGAFYEDILQ